MLLCTKQHLNQNLNPISYQKRGKKEERDNLKHKPGNFKMLLKVLMDFRSLKIRDKHMHQHKYISKKKSNNNNNNNNKNKIIK